MPVNNSAHPLWTNMTVSASVGGSVSGDVYVPQEPEHFGYDADGNLTNDGRWSYVWDGENRLIQMSVNTNVGPQYQLNFAYDYRGWRIQKAVAVGGIGDYTNNFLYDGRNLIATLNSQSSLLASYMWGSDLSGSMQGAGGVGGLLEEINYGTATNFVAFDGNGNVAALVNAADGTLTANYEYGPFGEPIRMTGAMGKNNPFRFSTKYDDDESDLLYYGYRYYKPTTGRWVNRDPIGEKGGLNLYCFTHNVPVVHIDRFGLDINNPPPSCSTDPNTYCCNWSTLINGFNTLTKRWRDAGEYLDSMGVGLDPNGVTGVSCIQSANSILSFMSPIPKCWKCYVERRGSWAAPFGGGDENYIRCDDASHRISTFPSFVFDWWYEKDRGYTTYTPISLNTYGWIFPFGPWFQPAAWYTEDAPAPYDTCSKQSDWRWGPENYDRWLVPLADQYGIRDF